MELKIPVQAFHSESLRLMVVGLNHRSAPLALREALALSDPQAADACRRFRTRFGLAELVVLSTCNRVECYMARPIGGGPTLEEAGAFLAECRGVPAQQVHAQSYHREDRAMVEHLFAVAASLDSMVIGETQILSQVKHAYQLARDAGSVGKVLHVLFQRAIAAAKDVHELTALSSGHLSIAGVAVELASSVFDRFDDKTVLCLGAGKMAGLMLRHLAHLKPGRLLVSNRTPERARELIGRFPEAQAHPLENLDTLLAEADIVLTGTGASEPLVTVRQFKGVLKARRYRPMVIVDVGVPRDVEAAVGTLENVYLYNIDDLETVAAGNRGRRSAEIEAAQALLAARVEEFLQWFAARDVGPLVRALYEQCHAVVRAELEDYLARHPATCDQERQELERLAHRMVGKILHGPVTRLTAQTEATARPMLAAAVRKLFELREESATP